MDITPAKHSCINLLCFIFIQRPIVNPSIYSLIIQFKTVHAPHFPWKMWQAFYSTDAFSPVVWLKVSREVKTVPKTFWASWVKTTHSQNCLSWKTRHLWWEPERVIHTNSRINRSSPWWAGRKITRTKTNCQVVMPPLTHFKKFFLPECNLYRQQQPVYLHKGVSYFPLSLICLHFFYWFSLFVFSM